MSIYDNFLLRYGNKDIKILGILRAKIRLRVFNIGEAVWSTCGLWGSRNIKKIMKPDFEVPGFWVS